MADMAIFVVFRTTWLLSSHQVVPSHYLDHQSNYTQTHLVLAYTLKLGKQQISLLVKLTSWESVGTLKGFFLCVN